MNKETVDKLMAGYLEDKARCTYLKTMLDAERQFIDRRMQTLVEDSVSIGGQEMDGMPHGSNVSSAVERLAISLADGNVPDYIKEAESKVKEMQREYNEKILGVLLVEGWMQAFSEEGKEYFVIWNKVIKGCTWRELIFAVNRKYGAEYSKNGLSMIKDKAMEKVYRIAA